MERRTRQVSLDFPRVKAAGWMSGCNLVGAFAVRVSFRLRILHYYIWSNLVKANEVRGCCLGYMNAFVSVRVSISTCFVCAWMHG